MDRNKELLEFKIIALGDSGVGKTSIFTRFAEDRFEKNIFL